MWGGVKEHCDKKKVEVGIKRLDHNNVEWDSGPDAQK